MSKSVKKVSSTKVNKDLMEVRKAIQSNIEKQIDDIVKDLDNPENFKKNEDAATIISIEDES